MCLQFFKDWLIDIDTHKSDHMRSAKVKKNDEYYTMYEDIDKELQHYSDKFNGKIVYCNCDNPANSSFWDYFHLNFKALGLKKLISTYYEQEKPTYMFEYMGGQDNDISYSIKTRLQGNGDFRSKECISLLKQCDIVVTNPPFSLFRDFINIIKQYNKQFIIWANNNSIICKNFFPLLKDNKVWLGYIRNKTCTFRVPDDAVKYDDKITAQMNDGNKYARLPSISVFTNIDNEIRHTIRLNLWCTYKDNEHRYPKYDNYNAINIDKVDFIPKDYKEPMGVPITFMSYYNSDQFELLGIMNTTEENEGIRYKGTKHGRPILNGKELYTRILIKQKELQNRGI
jgi:hypothetical protein